jgi:hypothetical protein
VAGPVHPSPPMRAAQSSAEWGSSAPDASGTAFCGEARP